MTSLKERISNIIAKISEGTFERDFEIKMAILSAIANESIFLLGKPGVAKSMIARRLKSAFKNSRNFEYLMNRFSTPDEIFGPVMISELKNNDKYIRQIENYLPNADVVFLDEIWKAGPSIQNALLTIINEKVFRNGDREIRVPMKALISASNELPAQGEGLEALWDRFLVRLVVNGISDRNNFEQMICSSKNQEEIKVDFPITTEEYHEWQKQIDSIGVEKQVLNIIDSIRRQVVDYDSSLYISDRRWKNIVHLMKTSAFLNDRKMVNASDCFLIKYCIWDNPEQIEEITTIVNETVIDTLCRDTSSELIVDQLYQLTNNIKNDINKEGKDYVFYKLKKDIDFNFTFKYNDRYYRNRWKESNISISIKSGGLNNNNTLDCRVKLTDYPSYPCYANIDVVFKEDGKKLNMQITDFSKNNNNLLQWLSGFCNVDDGYKELKTAVLRTISLEDDITISKIELESYSNSAVNNPDWLSDVTKQIEALIEQINICIENLSIFHMQNIDDYYSQLFICQTDMEPYETKVDEKIKSLKQLKINAEKLLNNTKKLYEALKGGNLIDMGGDILWSADTYKLKNKADRDKLYDINNYFNLEGYRIPSLAEYNELFKKPCKYDSYWSIFKIEGSNGNFCLPISQEGDTLFHEDISRYSRYRQDSFRAYPSEGVIKEEEIEDTFDIADSIITLVKPKESEQ